MENKKASVHRLTLTKDEFIAALERATESVRSWPSCRDTVNGVQSVGNRKKGKSNIKAAS